MNKRILSIALAGLVLFGLTAPSSAVATTGNQTFNDVVVGTITNGDVTPTHTVEVAHGVINAVGTDEFLPSQPGDPPNVDRGMITFPEGTISIKAANLTFAGGPPNPRTCIVKFTQTGTWDIVGGTGAYAGASGTLAYALRLVGTGNRLPGGSCDTSTGRFIIIQRVSGTLTIPSHQATGPAAVAAA